VRAQALEAVSTLAQLADAKQISVEVVAPTEGEGPLAVTADAVRLKQVLYNFISNAIKFTPNNGRVSVTVASVPGAKRVRTSVSDTGPGLALTKQLAELMGGSVGFESTLGQGSTFWVELPFYRETPTGDLELPRAPMSAPLALIIDDDARARELLDVALRGHGYRTDLASSGEEALERARQLHPQVITLDVFLPGIDGWEVLRALRGDPETASIPVVLVSISSDRGKAFGLGALDLLTKPVDRGALLEILQRANLTTKVQQRKVYVLAVDDDPQHLTMVRHTLEPRGFVVLTEETGRAGLERALSTPVDLMLLDLMLPDISGVEVVEAMRREEKTKGIPVVILTNHDITASERARLNGDVVAVLDKAQSGAHALLEQIDVAVGRRR
jgi:CheY-like chemotaxis protein